jgi:hypothetical protein
MSNEIAQRTDTGLPQAAELDQQIHYAEVLADAGLLPDAFKKNPPNVLIAIEVARTLDEAPFTVMQEMAVIGGKPSFQAKFMRTRVRKAGHRLRETFENGVARCVIIRRDDPDFQHVAEWDEAKAKKHGLWGKGHWAKNPQLMLQNRALSECVREACYEVMGGIAYTDDEAVDFPETAPAVNAQAAAPDPGRPAVDWHPIVDVMHQLDWSADDTKAFVQQIVGHEFAAMSDLAQDEIGKAAEAMRGFLTTVDAEVVDETTGEVMPSQWSDGDADGKSFDD